MDMVARIFFIYHQERRLEQRVFAVAMVLGFRCLMRPSEYTWGTKTNNHLLPASAFEWECEIPNQGLMMVGAHLIHKIPWSQVRLLRIYMSTAKNLRVGRALWFNAATSLESFHLIKVMYEWACASRPGLTDYLLSWPNGSSISPRDNLRYTDFQKVVKYAATLFDFAPDLFGCQSLRVGGATLLRAAGATDGKFIQWDGGDHSQHASVIRRCQRRLMTGC
jgi:hypothetical protein